MFKFFYIQLNSDGVVIGASELCGPVDSPEMVQTDSYRPDLIGKRRVGDAYIAVEITPAEPQPLAKISETKLERKITVNAFRNRFTPSEELAFESALATNPMLSLLDKRLAAVVATHVDLDDPKYVTEAMPALVAAGILTPERAQAILLAPTQWKELPPLLQQHYVAAGYQIDV